MGILNSIRKKSDNQKKVISLFLALTATFFIVGIWYSFTNNSPVDNDKLSSVSPWQMIKEEFSNAFSDFNSDILISENENSIPVEIILDKLSTSTATSSEDISFE